MKIVIAEKIAAAAVELFTSEPRWMVITPDEIHNSLAKQIESADALIVRSAVQVDSALLANARKLRVIGRAGVGVDNIELEAATKKGICVMNTPGASAVAVAEHTLALMLALARHVPKADALMKAGKWEKKTLQGSELRGKTLGIVGLGRIGMEVARRGLAFGMRVIAHDPYVSPQVAADAGVEMALLGNVLNAADYLTLHVGLTPQTTEMINTDSLRTMKRGVKIINCARGELVNEAQLADAIREGHVGGVATDVFTEEPPKDSPLLALKEGNVIATPHIAGSTYEAQDAVGVQIAMQVREYLKHGVIQNAVNVPSVTEDEYLLLRPYVTLGERLGSFLAQSLDGRLESISLRYTGPMADWKTDLVRNSVVKGVLNEALWEKANVVNAAAIAAERGIRVEESRKGKANGGGAANVLTVTMQTASEKCEVRGTVLHEDSARLTAIDGIDIEAPLERSLIYIRNRDVPGVVGRVGTILGNHRVNIADFALGRGQQTTKSTAVGKKTPGQERPIAVAVVHVDGKVPERVMQEIRKIDAVVTAKAIRL
jgi:D-3-phosphoglycerate dehydrogenase / 2-oxoglutarate reductase